MYAIHFDYYAIPDLCSTYNMNCPEPYYTFGENSELKANYVNFDITEKENCFGGCEFFSNGNFIVISNDCGLEISELNNWPGVKTKRCNKYIRMNTSAEAIIYRLNEEHFQKTPLDEMFYDASKLHALYTSSTTVLTHIKDYDNNIHCKTYTNTYSQDVGIIDPRIKNPNESIETMWDITTPISRFEENEHIFYYDNRPISKLNIDTLILLDDPMFKSLRKSILDALVDLIHDEQVSTNNIAEYAQQ